MRIRELKKKTRNLVEKSKSLEYRLEIILNLFPDLESYIEDIESLNELSQFSNLDKFSEDNDRVRNYLSKEEYDSLSENERNQLALDNYISGSKTKWQIGRDYEMCIAHQISSSGWDVEYFGIEKKLEDMGIDLIARNKNLTQIIQCKYWSQHKTIHEKHIAQLYGTTVQYILSNKNLSKAKIGKDVIPVFITNIELSETAKQFAKYLNVKILVNEGMTEFPRIKCNITKGKDGEEVRIYHLPMDQQYDNTKVCEEGEFFAYSVDEATKNGFRRAYRWKGNASEANNFYQAKLL